MKLVIVPPALGELHDAAAFYTESANVELGLRSSPSSSEQSMSFWKILRSG